MRVAPFHLRSIQSSVRHLAITRIWAAIGPFSNHAWSLLGQKGPVPSFEQQRGIGPTIGMAPPGRRHLAAGDNKGYAVKEGPVNILLSLAPFIVFFVLMRLVSPLAGLAAAFAVAVLLGVRQPRRGEQIKILEIGTLLLFGVLVVYTLVAAPHWSVATVRVVVDGGLLAIGLVSLLIGMPFHVAIRRPAGAEGILGFTDFFHNELADHRGLDSSVCGNGRGRRRR